MSLARALKWSLLYLGNDGSKSVENKESEMSAGTVSEEVCVEKYRTEREGGHRKQQMMVLTKLAPYIHIQVHMSMLFRRIRAVYVCVVCFERSEIK